MSGTQRLRLSSLRRHWRVWLVAAVIATLGFAVAEAHRREAVGWLSLQPDRSEGMGYEIARISGSIREGRGFVDPFKEPTGPTAWMPPALSYLLAGLRWLADDSFDTVVQWARRFQWVSVFVCVLPALLWSERQGHLAIAITVCSFAVIGNLFSLLQWTHDVTAQIPLVSVTWFLLLWVRRRELSLPGAVMFGGYGGLLALFGPALGFAWAVVTAGLFWRSKRTLAVIAVTSMLVITPWTVRNFHAFGTLVPIKSNLGYELWQSILVDDDGVLDEEALRIHPYVTQSGNELERVKQMGEIDYVREKRELALQAIREDPFDFVERIANRIAAAFLWYLPHRMSEYGRPWQLWMDRLLVILPTLSAIYLFAWSRRPVDPAVRIALALWLLLLAPYLIVSYYDRYALPALPMQMVVVSAALGRLVSGRHSSA